MNNAEDEQSLRASGDPTLDSSTTKAPTPEAAMQSSSADGDQTRSSVAEGDKGGDSQSTNPNDDSEQPQSSSKGSASDDPSKASTPQVAQQPETTELDVDYDESSDEKLPG
jgi:hypothetical protein